ncbi:MAG: hypothetical protein EPN75_05980 [Beijerinckiaceae bacterium]|nr:MAG: hypothetical protein EPN75_05980 [Beijerinckiaceae bacterium]
MIGALAAACFAFASVPDAFAAPACNNDYPTSVRADYVFACMKVNGDTRDSLQRCSCSIDVIATLLPYDKYVSGETVASVDLSTGVIGRMFKATPLAKQQLKNLRNAQAEAEVRCF